MSEDRCEICAHVSEDEIGLFCPVIEEHVSVDGYCDAFKEDEQKYCGTCGQASGPDADGSLDCPEFVAKTKPTEPACEQWRAKVAKKEGTLQVPEEINENQSLKGLGVSEEMPDLASTQDFDLYAIPGVREAIAHTMRLLYKAIKEGEDTRQHKLVVEAKINPETLAIDVDIKGETPKPRPIKESCKTVYGVRENGTIRIEAPKQEPLFPKA